MTNDKKDIVAELAGEIARREMDRAEMDGGLSLDRITDEIGLMLRGHNVTVPPRAIERAPGPAGFTQIPLYDLEHMLCRDWQRFADLIRTDKIRKIGSGYWIADDAIRECDDEDGESA